MQAEVYVKARKVFVPEKVENTEKCPQCEEDGQTYFLRYFYLNFEEAIYKCANSKCLYPFHHFVFKNLINKSVYYYEEVDDGTNDIMFKVSMDEQNKYKSVNPMRTALFSESQHNPDIESYDFDILDFLNDTVPDPSTSKATTANPNNDFLDFLDEIPSTSKNTNTNQNNFDASGFIDNLLHTTPTINWPNQQKSPPRLKEAKLSKAVEHIKRANKRKKVKEESKETFLQKIVKRKAAQSTNEINQTAADKVSTLVNNAQKLRPTQLLSQIRSLDLKNSNSSFLRTLAKLKEENKDGVVEAKEETINAPSVAEPTKSAQTKKSRQEKQNKNEMIIEKKEPKPRKIPVKRPAKISTKATIAKAESVNDEKIKNIAKPPVRGSMPVAIDLSKINLPQMDNKEFDKKSQINETPKISAKRPRKKKTEVKPEPKRVKIEKLDEDLANLSTTMNTQNDVPDEIIVATAGKAKTPGKAKISVKRTRKKKTEAKPESSKMKLEQLDEGLADLSTTMNTQNDVRDVIITAPTETTGTVPQIENEIPIEAEKLQIENSNEKPEELSSNHSYSESDDEDPLTAFSPVTESDLSKNQLTDLKTLNLIPFTSTIEKPPTKRPYKRRTTISAKESNENDNSDSQSQVSESNARQESAPKRVKKNQNNNNTEVETNEPKEVGINSFSSVIELSDHSNEPISPQNILTFDVEDDASAVSNHVLTFDVEDDTSIFSIETETSESNANLENKMQDVKSKLNTDNRYHRKKFEKTVDTDISVDALINDWDSATEKSPGLKSNANRSSVDSDISIIYLNDPLDDIESGSTISLDSRTTTEIDE